MFRKSQTFKSLVRLLAQLPQRRKRALMRLIPLAILAGVADLVVVALVARRRFCRFLFTTAHFAILTLDTVQRLQRSCSS